MTAGGDEAPTWVRLPQIHGLHDIGVFELMQRHDTPPAQSDVTQGSTAVRRLEDAKSDTSEQNHPHDQHSITTRYFQRVMPWLEIPVTPSYIPAMIDQIIGLFFSHHVLTTDVYTNCLPGYLEELPPMYHNASTDSALVESVKAVSLMGALSRNELERGSAFHDMALRSYSQALRKLRMDLENPETATEDATLMTIIMLDQMETYAYPDRSLPLGAHFAGLIYVMQLRGQAQLFSQRGWSLFRVAHHRLLNRQLMTFTRPLPESHAWLNLINKRLPHTKNASLILKVIDAVATTRPFLDQLSDGTTSFGIADRISFLFASVNRLDDISRELGDWVRMLPPVWRFNSQSLATQLSAEVPWLPVSRIHLYRNTWIACQWQWRHGAHIMLLETLRSTLIHLQSFQSDPELSATQARIIQCTNTIVRLGYDIFAAVPQLTSIVDASGEMITNGSGNIGVKQVGGYYAMFAMQVVQRAPSTTREQKKAAEETLRRVRGEVPRSGP